MSRLSSEDKREQGFALEGKKEGKKEGKREGGTEEGYY